MKSARKKPSAILSETSSCSHTIQKEIFCRKMRNSSYSPTYLLSFPYTYFCSPSSSSSTTAGIQITSANETFYVTLLFPLVWPYIRT